MNIKCSGVIDITKDSPFSTDSFLIDTNVFLWLTYSRLSLLENKYREYQVDSYPQYLESAIDKESKLRHSRLSLGEISHFIEKCEHEIYILNNDNKDLYFKAFRTKFPDERKKVVNEIQNSFEFIKSVSESISENLDDQAIAILEDDLRHSFLDGTDSFLINFAKRNGIKQIISDDGDFASVEDIYLFTANQYVIRNAKRQGKLIVR